MTDLDELIARIEAATSWDRQLDDDIADAIYTGKHRVCIAGLTDQAGGMWMFTYPDGSVGSSLRFTGSIDAALTLVPTSPNQWYLAIDQWPSRTMKEVHARPGDWAYSVNQYRATLTENGGGFRQTTSVCDSIALALCAAALKARNA